MNALHSRVVCGFPQLPVLNWNSSGSKHESGSGEPCAQTCYALVSLHAYTSLDNSLNVPAIAGVCSTEEKTTRERTDNHPGSSETTISTWVLGMFPVDASQQQSCCEGPCGAVRLALLPSFRAWGKTARSSSSTTLGGLARRLPQPNFR